MAKERYFNWERGFESLVDECKEAGFRKNGGFRLDFKDKLAGELSPFKLSLAQENGIYKMISFLSEGYTKRELNFFLVRKILRTFIRETEGKNKDQVRTVLRGMTTLPKTLECELSIKIRTPHGWQEKERWGQNGVIQMIIDKGYLSDERTDYVNLLKLIARRRKGK